MYIEREKFNNARDDLTDIQCHIMQMMLKKKNASNCSLITCSCGTHDKRKCEWMM